MIFLDKNEFLVESKFARAILGTCDIASKTELKTKKKKHKEKEKEKRIIRVIPFICKNVSERSLVQIPTLPRFYLQFSQNKMLQEAVMNNDRPG